MISAGDASPPRALRILHVCPRPSFSGLEAYALAMGEGQSKLGHDVTFVTQTGSPLEEKARTASLKTISIPAGLGPHLGFAFKMIANFRSPAGFDIVHLHSTQDLDLMLFTMLASRFAPRRPRFIVQTHIWISHSKKDPLHAIAYSLVDELWCSSEPARKTLERFIPISPKKIRVISYGRETKTMLAGFKSREEARAQLGLPNDATVIGTVARIDKGKGTRELLDATLEVMKHDQKLHLVWIGPPTADDPKAVAFGQEILAQIASLPAEFKSRVHAPGAVPNSYQVLKAFDLFALPTYMECFALSLLEAQLAGLPCLATDAGGSPQVVREGETGWLFEPRSTKACLDAIERALAQRNRWPEYGEAARKQVLENYDFERLLPQSIAAYRVLLTT